MTPETSVESVSFALLYVRGFPVGMVTPLISSVPFKKYPDLFFQTVAVYIAVKCHGSRAGQDNRIAPEI